MGWLENFLVILSQNWVNYWCTMTTLALCCVALRRLTAIFPFSGNRVICAISQSIHHFWIVARWLVQFWKPRWSGGCRNLQFSVRSTTELHQETRHFTIVGCVCCVVKLKIACRFLRFRSAQIFSTMWWATCQHVCDKKTSQTERDRLLILHIVYKYNFEFTFWLHWLYFSLVNL